MKAVGHRVVHGRNIDKALLVDDKVIAAIKDAADLAPLHNPGKSESRSRPSSLMRRKSWSNGGSVLGPLLKCKVRVFAEQSFSIMNE